MPRCSAGHVFTSRWARQVSCTTVRIDSRPLASCTLSREQASGALNGLDIFRWYCSPRRCKNPSSTAGALGRLKLAMPCRDGLGCQSCQLAVLGWCVHRIVCGVCCCGWVINWRHRVAQPSRSCWPRKTPNWGSSVNDMAAPAHHAATALSRLKDQSSPISSCASRAKWPSACCSSTSTSSIVPMRTQRRPPCCAMACSRSRRAA